MILFGPIYPKGIDDSFYTLICLIEYFTLIMVRTKRSIAYFPKIIFLLVVSLIIYRQNHFYPFLRISMQVVNFFTVAALAFTVFSWEKPTFMHEGPTPRRPRLMYHPVFTQHPSPFPELWTMFMILEPAGFFTPEELPRNHRND